MSRSVLPLLCAALTLAACTGGGGGGTGETHADAATQAACRQRADEIYNQQNRGDIYRPPSQVNTPFSADYTPGISDRGLSDLYAHEKLVSDCVRNTGTGSDRSAEQPSSPAAAPPKH
jgi:hypothetical protein